MHINFDFNDLNAFLKVAEYASFQQAATALNLSQPALTRRIQKLEKALETLLFERTTRSVTLTPTGKNFRARAEIMLEEASEAVLALHDHQLRFDHQRKTIITIAIVPTVTRDIITSAIKAFHADGHQARIRLLDGNAHEVTEAVLQGQADFGLSFMPAEDPTLHFTSLWEEYFVLVLHKDDQLANNLSAPINWSLIDTSRLIVPWKGTGNRMLIDDALAKAGKALGWGYEIKRSATMLDMVASGVGMTLLPYSALPKYRDSDIVYRKLCKPEVTRKLGIIQRTGGALTPLAKTLLALMNLQAND